MVFGEKKNYNTRDIQRRTKKKKFVNLTDKYCTLTKALSLITNLRRDSREKKVSQIIKQKYHFVNYLSINGLI